MESESHPQPFLPWRPSPFKTGHHYVVLENFNTMPGAFTAGEVLKFQRQEWLFDQSLTSFLFSDADGAIRRWEVYDEDDLGKWSLVFAPSQEE